MRLTENSVSVYPICEAISRFLSFFCFSLRKNYEFVFEFEI